MPLKSLLPIVEIGFGIYFSYLVYYAFALGHYLTLPFLVTFQVGFFYVALSSLGQWWPRFNLAAAGEVAVPA
jgi:hypothetical protein